MQLRSILIPALVAFGPLVWTACTSNVSGERADAAPACDPANGGIELPDGFCAAVVAEDLGRVRHLVVGPNGDIYAAIGNTRSARGGVVALRDTTGDRRADVQARFGDDGGTGIALRDGFLYFATDEAVLRYPLEAGRLEPVGAPDTIVSGLPAERSHRAKSIAVTDDGVLFINIGSPSNACQFQDRQPGSVGMDPCPELERRAGIWAYDADQVGQTHTPDARYATGLRNTVALALGPAGETLYGVVHGRDQLHANWPELFTERESAEKPAEEFFRITEGADFGWPYCYYDPAQDRKVLASEYGGDGETVGRCAETDDPILAFPAHWAPNALLFYTGDEFPERYRGGAFIAFHGSWNRAPLPQQGYSVAYAPFEDGEPTGEYAVFADGFAGAVRQPGEAEHRPSGLAQGPDGALYIGDDAGGTIWRVVYTGSGEAATGGAGR